MRLWLLAGFFALTFSLAITACGSGVDDGGGSTATTTSKAAGTATATRTPNPSTIDWCRLHVITEAEVGQILGENVVAIPSSSDATCTYVGGNSDTVTVFLTGLGTDPVAASAAFTSQKLPSDTDIVDLGDGAFSHYASATPDAVNVYVRTGATELAVYVHRAQVRNSNLAAGKQVAQIVLGRLP
jgi:hypothetical protein